MKNTLCELLDQATILGHRKTNKEIAEYLESCGVIVCRQDELPAADVQPVKHGYWIKRAIEEEPPRYKSFAPIWACSECGIEYNSPTVCQIIRYCPNCGAKMESEDK